MEHLLETGTFDLSKTGLLLPMLARYYCHALGYEEKKIKEKLNEFMTFHYPRYNPVDWSLRIEKYSSRASKYPLCQCEGIWITENELNTIESLQNKVMERLAFTLLCLAKFRNFKNENNHSWVTDSDSEIYKLACITTSAFDKDIRFNQLRDLGLIEFAKKVDNLSIHVLYTDDKSPRKLFINDFRKLGYEWRLYKGEEYIRCAGCKILVRKTSLNRKYCKDCTKQNPYYSPIGIKSITCADCGKTFHAPASSRECRCEDCKTFHKKELQKIKMRRYRNKTAV